MIYVTISYVQQRLHLGGGPRKHVPAPTSITPTSHNWSLKSSRFKGITAAAIQLCGPWLDYIPRLQKNDISNRFYIKGTFAVGTYKRKQNSNKAGGRQMGQQLNIFPMINPLTSPTWLLLGTMATFYIIESLYALCFIYILQREWVSRGSNTF